jgi:hypothetical protein
MGAIRDSNARNREITRIWGCNVAGEGGDDAVLRRVETLDTFHETADRLTRSRVTLHLVAMPENRELGRWFSPKADKLWRGEA